MIVPRSRPYRSLVRQRAAVATQDAIAAAARGLFREPGYRRTTIRAIAHAAEVSPQTVYAVFGSKRGILVELVRRAKEQAAVGATYAELVAEADPARKLALSVVITVRWAHAAADLVDLVRAEANSDEDVAAAWNDAENRRLNGNRGLIDSLAQANALRPDLTRQHATDLLWSLQSTDLYRLLVIERGWSDERYATELQRLLINTLLKQSH